MNPAACDGKIRFEKFKAAERAARRRSLADGLPLPGVRGIPRRQHGHDRRAAQACQPEEFVAHQIVKLSI